MAIRKIVKMGDELLRKKSKAVTKFDDSLHEILDDMKETMYEYNGMGLAAPQVGILKRIVVMEVNNMYLELVNPEIIEAEGSDIEAEGCLSCGKINKKVERPMKVTVKAQDRYGYDVVITGEKWLARCICHEIDHLNGVLFIDKAID